jgi:hypothetical protein
MGPGINAFIICSACCTSESETTSPFPCPYMDNQRFVRRSAFARFIRRNGFRVKRVSTESIFRFRGEYYQSSRANCFCGIGNADPIRTFIRHIVNTGFHSHVFSVNLFFIYYNKFPAWYPWNWKIIPIITRIWAKTGLSTCVNKALRFSPIKSVRCQTTRKQSTSPHVLVCFLRVNVNYFKNTWIFDRNMLRCYINELMCKLI